MNIKAFDVALVGIIVAMVEVVKRVGLPDRFAPLVALVLGILLGIIYIPGDIAQGVIVGMAMGLTAVGLYSGTKNVVKGGGEDDSN